MIAISLEKYVVCRRQQKSFDPDLPQKQTVGDYWKLWYDLALAELQIPEDSLGSWRRSRNRLTMYSNPEEWTMDQI
jgi:hypothetical protein